MCGFHAVKSTFDNSSIDIVRFYLTKDRLGDFRDELRWCAEERIAYHILTPDEMDTVAESTHHEGVCLLRRLRKEPSLRAFLETHAKNAPHVVLVAEGVENPHNQGAILRVAAHYGVTAAVFVGGGKHLGGSAWRSAEGGAEHVPTHFADTSEEVLTLLQEKGYQIVATTSHGGADTRTFAWGSRVAVVMGSEGEGLSPDWMDQKGGVARVCIAGTGRVESLNVSVAAGILLHDCTHFQALGARP